MIFYNGQIVTMNEQNEILTNGWIEIENSRIKDLGVNKKFENGVNLNGDILIPGLINGHTHTAMSLLRGYADDLNLMEWLEKHIWPAEGKYMNRESVVLGTKLGIMEMISCGTTAFCDMYFFCKDTVKTAEEIGIKGIFAEGIIDYPTPNMKNGIDSLKYVMEAFSQWKGKTSKIAISVHAAYSTSKELIKQSAEFANKNNILFITHTAETLDEISIIRKKYNKTPVELFDEFIPEKTKTAMAHMVHIDENDMKICFKRGFAAIHNPQSNLKLSSGIAKIQKMLEHNMIVGIGTDGAASNNNLDIIEEMRTAAMIGKMESPCHVNAIDVLKMATINGAKALSIDDETGSLEKGKSADIVRISTNGIENYPYYGNPYSFIVYALNSRDIIMTMINGRIVYEKGEYKTLDENEIKKDVRKWQENLL